jgi:hypothetical protein
VSEVDLNSMAISGISKAPFPGPTILVGKDGHRASHRHGMNVEEMACIDTTLTFMRVWDTKMARARYAVPASKMRDSEHILLIHSEMYDSLMSLDLFMVKNDCM